MKEGIHPNYREVLFHDVSNDFKFVTRSTIQTKDTIEHEGKTYPLAKIEVSSESHPFYTGTQKIMDTAGRVESSARSSAASWAPPRSNRPALCEQRRAQGQMLLRRAT
jgi:large subunit ribosomal protein L31